MATLEVVKRERAKAHSRLLQVRLAAENEHLFPDCIQKRTAGSIISIAHRPAGDKAIGAALQIRDVRAAKCNNTKLSVLDAYGSFAGCSTPTITSRVREVGTRQEIPNCLKYSLGETDRFGTAETV
jgi:hypothetical protein